MRKRTTRYWVFGCSTLAMFGLLALTGRADSTPINLLETAPPQSSHAIAHARWAAARRHHWRLVRQSHPACGGLARLRMGVASWYDGPTRHTADGEIFHANRLAAASRSLPFNTHVRVTNLRNGRSVVVRINDRGPFVHGRVIDLTPSAAEKLKMKRKGLAPVYLQIVQNDTKNAVAESVDDDQP